MAWFRELARRLLMLFRRRQFDADLAEEMRLHREWREQEEIERGLSAREAYYAAQRRFGNELVLREESHDMWGWNWLETLLQDIRYGLRILGANPGFALVAVASLTLGIGANAAIFQLLDAVRLRSLPIPNSQELAEIRIVGGNGGMGINNGKYPELTRPLWQELRADHEPFSGVFAWAADGENVGSGEDRHWRRALWVSGEAFSVLGVSPWRGRLLGPEDEGGCPAMRAVVSYAFWQTEMGGRQLDAHTTLRIEDESVQVVGVTPPQFFGLAVGDGFDIAQPFCQPKEELRRDAFDIAVMGRLRLGWTLQRASAWLGTVSRAFFEATAPTERTERSIETYKRFRLAAYPGSSGVSRLREEYDSSLSLLLGVTGLVLLLACANLANLMLARASARAQEMAVRRALGASRTRLLRQLLVESGVLAAGGAALGIGVAHGVSRVLVWSLSTESNALYLPLTTDWRVLGFTTALAALAAMVFGVAPALSASHADPAGSMKSSGRGIAGGRRRYSLQRTMVVSQIAVSLVLLVGALLFVRSFNRLMTFYPGMREAGISVAILTFQHSPVTRDHYAEFVRQLLDEVRSVPGVLGAATTTNIPLLGGSWAHQIHVGTAEGESKFTWVSPGYFDTMGIPVIVGRDLDEHDTATSARVVVVNKAFVGRFLGNANPLGKALRTDKEPDYPSTVYNIVGVIRDTQYNDLRGKTPPMAFAPASQYPAQGRWTLMMIHSNAPSAVIMAAVRRKIAENHPEIVTSEGDFQAWIHEGLVRERLMATLSGFFGLVAALLAMTGLYGVISYMVARRRNEFGVRLALGARRGQLVGMVMREAGGLVLLGVVIGAALSLAAGRWAGSLLFRLKPYDPVTLGAAVALLTAVAAVASFLPARRAASTDPMVALRYE
jgi:predicted permease